jgi:hypothetical protein
MTAVLQQNGEAFLDTARRALRGSDGRDPLASLGWWDLFPDLADAEARGAALALFRAQGRELANTAALGALMAQPFLAATGLPPRSLAATISRRSARRGERLVVIGDVEGRSLLVDRPGHGAAVVSVEDVVLQPVTVAGRLAIHEVEWNPCGWVPTVEESQARPARVRSQFLGRIALALEILGAAESALALGVEHATNREQFGKPIATFQAVRHLLAWASTDCAALESATAIAVSLDEATPARYDEVVKALAGRNGLRVCERTLQVLGAVGFTSEHAHHHFYSRILALDSLLGTSADLTYALGSWVRETQTDPALSAAVLLPGLGTGFVPSGRGPAVRSDWD